MIIIKKFLFKKLFKAIKRNFLKKNDIILTKLFLFKLVIKELFIFKKIKNVNNYSACLLSCDSNKLNMIFFINVIFENVKGEVCEFEVRFRIYITRASIKP